MAVRVPDHGERVPVRRHRLRVDGLGGEAGLVQDRGRGRQVKKISDFGGKIKYSPICFMDHRIMVQFG